MAHTIYLESFLKSLLRLSVLRYFSNRDQEAFFHTEAHEELINSGVALGEKAMGKPFQSRYTPGDPFWKMTDIEIADFCIKQLLTAFSLPQSHDKQLYIVVPETPISGNKPRLFLDDSLDIHLWDSQTNIAPDSGWDTEQLAHLQALQIGEGVLNYSECHHCIFRVQ